MSEPTQALAELWAFCRARDLVGLEALLQGHAELKGLLGTMDETTELHDMALTACCRSDWMPQLQEQVLRLSRASAETEAEEALVLGPC
jgi:hypothetical protein